MYNSAYNFYNLKKSLSLCCQGNLEKKKRLPSVSSAFCGFIEGTAECFSDAYIAMAPSHPPPSIWYLEFASVAAVAAENRIGTAFGSVYASLGLCSSLLPIAFDLEKSSDMVQLQALHTSCSIRSLFCATAPVRRLMLRPPH